VQHLRQVTHQGELILPKTNIQQVLRIVVPLLAISLLSSCGTDSAPDKVTYSQLFNDEFKGCGSSCHNSNAADGTENGPDLSTADSFYTSLINKTVNNDYPNWIRGGDCDSIPFINPGNAAKSLIVTGLIQSDADNILISDNCTSAFNLHEVIASYNNPSAVVEWINNGAIRTAAKSAN
jgi:hypothetical protein